MGKGLSLLQEVIVGLLDGSIPRREFSASGGLITRELVEELTAAGLLSDSMSKRQATFTVRRACTALLRRGKLAGEYDRLYTPPFSRTIIWSACSAPESTQEHQG